MHTNSHLYFCAGMTMLCEMLLFLQIGLLPIPCLLALYSCLAHLFEAADFNCCLFLLWRVVHATAMVHRSIPHAIFMIPA